MSRPAADDVLTHLLATVEGQPVNLALLQAVMEEASEAGACRALSALGLQDGTARRDMDELRELLGTWRDVKKSAWQAVAKWVVRIFLAALVVSIAYQTNLRALVKG